MIGSSTGDCAPAPSHTTGRTVFRIRRLDPATVPTRRKTGRPPTIDRLPCLVHRFLSGWTRQKVMHEDLMDQGVAEENLARARAAVKRNRGAAGIDRMTVNELEVHWQRHGAKMRAKLVAGRWTPSPVRRAEIPKPNGGTRPLGIPTVMDRVVQQALLQVLQPIFDPRFSESSYG